MIVDNLTNKTAFLFAARSYTNINCTGREEFEQDLQRLKYIKRLLRRYKNTGAVKERLLVNHVISLYNTFETAAVCRLLFLRCDQDCWPALKTLLEFLNLMPEQLDPVNGAYVINSTIPRDMYLWKRFQDL